MKNIFTLYFICFSLITLFGQKNRHLIYFKSNESILNSKHTKELDSLISCIVKNPSAKLLIIGHTDSIGTFDANKKLSLNRASSIESYFIDKGIDKKKIQKEFYGYLFPIASNKKEVGRAKNRRTEIVVYTEKELTEYKKAKRTQIFSFNNNAQDLNIRTKRGALIRIPSNSLTSKSKSEIKNIRIEITEAYTIFDMILNNLNTLTDNSILESNGMINIKAFDKNGEIFLKDNASMFVAIPTNNKQTDMLLYKQSTDTSSYWNLDFEESYPKGTPHSPKNSESGLFSFTNRNNIDSNQLSKRLIKSFGNKFADTLNARGKYFFSAQTFGYYNIDKELKQNKVDTVVAKNNESVNLTYKMIINNKKSIYFQQTTSAKEIFIKRLIDENSTLIAYKFDILENIVQYDIQSVSNLSELKISLKTKTLEDFKNELKKLNLN